MFILVQLKANSKVWEVIIRDMLFADGAALEVSSSPHILDPASLTTCPWKQRLTKCLARAQIP
ncbi:hypothetical protein DPMN_140512 [Dreissena polymorpha]|uniref:Uncharacterized protein n=1 Tax=Dreissena polymorpha TaxID=45954 RepID=A0A9D4JGR4_DREPO|nr:hypothetical protein DPMN_140512 [Dreissena polymorpha]